MNQFEKMLEKTGEYGEIVQVKYPIIILDGLPNARLHEMLIFEDGTLGEVFAVLKDQVQAVAYSREPLKLKLRATYLDKFLSTPVGMELMGHTIDPLGRPFSEEDVFKKPAVEREIDIQPLGISARARIDQLLLTGISVVDLMLPLGKGQRELVVGDRKVGKTGFLLSVMKNQAALGAKIVYVALARQQNEIKKVQEYFQQEKMEKNLIIVATLPYESPGLIFLTPYTGMTQAEYLRDEGFDVLLVIDDLSTHARFYRELALIAKRFPGRDSFPGDIFYIHSRLLERGGNFKTPHGNKAISVLAVTEITEGDFTGFIPTNLMSMTDGHIFFDNDLFYEGRRPAVNIFLSVTRVGRQAQPPLLRDINRELTVFLSHFSKLMNVSQFGAELAEEAKQSLKTGKLIEKLFQQEYGEIIPLEEQLICLAIAWLGLVENEEMLDKAKRRFLETETKDKMKKWEKEIMVLASFKDLLAWVSSHQKEFLPNAE